MNKVLIIDDEAASRSLIREYLQGYEDFELIGECENGMEAIEKINLHSPDLIFLDIQMPGCTGFEVVQQLTRFPKIVFITAYDQYAIKAFDSNAIDYLLKPFTAQRFKQSLEKVKSIQFVDQMKFKKMANEFKGEPPRRILVENGNKLVSLSVEDICCFEAEKDYTWIFTENRSYLSNYGIGALEQRMDKNLFLRIHRSCIVNLNCIQEVYREGYAVKLKLKNEKLVTVSRGYVDGLKQYFY